LKTALQQHKSGFAFFTVRDQGERSTRFSSLSLNKHMENDEAAAEKP